MPAVANQLVEMGVVALALAAIGRVAAWVRITAVPLYLIAGLALGDGGLIGLRVSDGFVELTSEVGVILLLLALGLEYEQSELRSGLRSGVWPGVVDMVANAVPGFLFALILGWGWQAAVLLGGITWVSSSGIIAKVLRDLDRLAFRETSTILRLLVIEDLAMAVYLPVAAALVVGGTPSEMLLSVAGAVAAVTAVSAMALHWGDHIAALLGAGSDEALLLAVFGLTLLVAGLAEWVGVSGAIGAFLVGLALSGSVGERAARLIAPLRDLFAATFFLFFSLRVDPAALAGAALPALILAGVTMLTKIGTGWYAARRDGVGRGGRLRVGTALVARGEFSIVIAALAVGVADGAGLGALATAYVLVLAVAGPVATRLVDTLATRRLARYVRTRLT
ncbi:MAG TPA: cation:proton antiporter [Ilumatobacter sp.]|nr:cation:proton antiporter [Ilumatobacter sp.]